MPIFEYQCQQCQHRFEVLQRVRQETPSPPTCPRCGSQEVQRLISRFHSNAWSTFLDRLESSLDRPPV
ncbi:MAG: zinc ribbon domain-containing protein [Nitrospinota bacterium]|nr:MAG: zinc ribbon domain-containing protein [Nitrospinota bacterium]